MQKIKLTAIDGDSKVIIKVTENEASADTLCDVFIQCMLGLGYNKSLIKNCFNTSVHLEGVE